MHQSTFDRAGRRSAISRISLALVAGSFADTSWGQKFPSKPFKIVVGSPPGALGDVVARLLARKLTESSGQPVIVDNKAGATGVIAADAVARSAKDGYTLLLAPDSTFAVNPFVYKSLPYDPRKSFAPVGMVSRAILVLIVNPTLGVRTLDEFVKLVRSKPGIIDFGSGGAGHVTHMSMGLLCDRLKLNMRHIPYKGTTPAMQAILSNEVGAMIIGLAEAVPHIKAGTVVALGIGGSTPLDVLPGVPPLKNYQPDLDASVWFAMFAPAGTPVATVNYLNGELNKALGQPDLKKEFSDLAMLETPGTPGVVDTVIASDLRKFEPLVKSLGITAS
ncbi:MAG: putative exported protein [Polaromonas sp.]|jgi:tripartite-type tricarboxylate transporter receptor subunit TctC|nr:putative exported protein [Polaromonas sp.]